METQTQTKQQINNKTRNGNNKSSFTKHETQTNEHNAPLNKTKETEHEETKTTKTQCNKNNSSHMEKQGVLNKTQNATQTKQKQNNKQQTKTTKH